MRWYESSPDSPASPAASLSGRYAQTNVSGGKKKGFTAASHRPCARLNTGRDRKRQSDDKLSPHTHTHTHRFSGHTTVWPPGCTETRFLCILLTSLNSVRKGAQVERRGEDTLMFTCSSTSSSSSRSHTHSHTGRQAGRLRRNPYTAELQRPTCSY